MEFLGTRIQVSEKLLWVLCLFVILLLLANNVTELVGANLAYPLVVLLEFNTLIMIGVSTHEVNGWQTECLAAAVTVFWVEVFCLGLQIFDLRSHVLDLFHVFLYLLIILSGNSILDFESVNQIVLNNTEFKIWSTLENFKNQKW